MNKKYLLYLNDTLIGWSYSMDDIDSYMNLLDNLFGSFRFDIKITSKVSNDDDDIDLYKIVHYMGKFKLPKRDILFYEKTLEKVYVDFKITANILSELPAMFDTNISDRDNIGKSLGFIYKNCSTFREFKYNMNEDFFINNILNDPITINKIINYDLELDSRYRYLINTDD